MHIAEHRSRTIFSQILIFLSLALSLGHIIPSISSSRAQSTIQVGFKKIKHGFVLLLKSTAPLQSKWKVKLNGRLNWLEMFSYHHNISFQPSQRRRHQEYLRGASLRYQYDNHIARQWREAMLSQDSESDSLLHQTACCRVSSLTWLSPWRRSSRLLLPRTSLPTSGENSKPVFGCWSGGMNDNVEHLAEFLIQNG